VNRDAEQVLAVGLNDINFLGRFVDLGLYFETFNGAPSISVSYRDPRFLNQRMSVGGSIGHLIHNRTVYEEGGQELGSFSVVRQSLRSYVSKEWKKDLSAGLFLDLNHLYYSEDFLSASDRQNNNNQAYLLPQNSEAHLIGATAELGRLNYETEMIEGQLTTTRLAFAHPAWGATEAFYVFDTSYLWFAKMANQANLGFRVGLSVTDSRDAEFQIYRGGNNWVRGLIPGLYRGQLALQINSEYRLSSFRRPWLIFQNVVFFDAGLAADDLAQVFSDQRHTAAAAGLGLRILSPKVYRLNLRLDYTALSSASAYEQISLGFEQFF
jgi:outer membrane protein assembly factor BamA